MTVPATAALPTVLSDKVFRGSGTIDILKNATGGELASYLQANQRLFLGIDINESSAAPESPRSQGVAIQSMKLLLTTSAGDFSFTDFFTNTTAMIRAEGSASAQQFYTAFGQTGSSQLNSGTKNFALGAFDDVIVMNNINFTGNILSAKLEVAFLKTASDKNAGINEKFFDFSAGFEDFAILTAQDAALVDKAAIGLADAPKGLQVTVDPTREVAALPPPVPLATPAPAPTPAPADTTAPAPVLPPVLEPVQPSPVPPNGGDSTAPAPSEPPVLDPVGPPAPDNGSGAGSGGSPGGGSGGSSGGGIDLGGGMDINPSPSANPPTTAIIAPGAPAPPTLLLVTAAGLLAFYRLRRPSSLS